VITIRETGCDMLALVNRKVHGMWQWTHKSFVFKGHDAMGDLVDSNYAEGWVAEEQDRRRLASRSYGLARVRIGRMQGCVRCVKCKQTGGQ
jgi:hypothetical protein